MEPKLCTICNMTGTSSVLSEDDAIADFIWKLKYRQDGEASRIDSFRRIANAISKAEPDRDTWQQTFFTAFRSNEMLPGGRIIANAGTANNDKTLCNTFGIPELRSGTENIHQLLWYSASTMRAGGGIGINLSQTTPVDKFSSNNLPLNGPVAIMRLWNLMCEALVSSRTRRGAMIALLDCSHPDIESFISSKKDKDALKRFCISVLITDEFMDAVHEDRDWALKYDGVIFKRIRARDLWLEIIRSSYVNAEPGIVFIDRINRENNLAYCETIITTNSCAEQPLPPNGATPLASINLAALIREPFSDVAYLDVDRFTELIHIGVRFLDNVIELANFPFEAQRIEALSKRRIGLGITGVGDALILSKARYGSEEAVDLLTKWLSVFQRESYRASVQLARERGSFPGFDMKFLEGKNVQQLPLDLKKLIMKDGIRNGVINCIAPTGSISLLAGNVSAGIEPVFAHRMSRRISIGSDRSVVVQQTSWSLRCYSKMGFDTSQLPHYFASALEITPDDHILMLATAQRYIDASISKTINCPLEISLSDYEAIHRNAYLSGCKSVSTYRPTGVRSSILAASVTSAETR